MPQPKKHWLVRKASQASTCYLCQLPVAKGDSIARWGRYWPHFACAKRRDEEICAQQ